MWLTESFTKLSATWHAYKPFSPSPYEILITYSTLYALYITLCIILEIENIVTKPVVGGE